MLKNDARIAISNIYKYYIVKVYGDRIAILGGIDMDFMCRETPEKISDRCRKMLDKTAGKGGYALGTGNSVPDHIPFENYMAMIRTALEY